MSPLPKREKKKGKRDPFDGEYVGNIWGWRFSLFGLLLILLLMALMIYRHLTLGVPFNAPVEEEKTEMPSQADGKGEGH